MNKCIGLAAPASTADSFEAHGLDVEGGKASAYEMRIPARNVFFPPLSLALPALFCRSSSASRATQRENTDTEERTQSTCK